ncbi:MAG: hypothetical protein ACI9DJ_000966 [Algoriphagus sp.]|jgi:hypothetical protein
MTILMIIHVSGFKHGEPQYAVFIKRELENLKNADLKVIPLY